MNDPLAEALCDAACAADNDLNTSGEYNCTLNLDYGEHTASWLRERRLSVVRALYPDTTELLRDLGGECVGPSEAVYRTDGDGYDLAYGYGGESVWVFPKEDA